MPQDLGPAMKASNCVEVIRPLRSAIARTLVISMNHQIGTSAVCVVNRVSKASVFGVAARYTWQFASRGELSASLEGLGVFHEGLPLDFHQMATGVP